MIRWLSGKIIDKSFSEIVIASEGVGYRVFCTPQTITDSIREKEQATLWIHTSVKENAIDFYGFTDKEDLNFFELLLSVNGIGPKSALSIMSTSSTASIKDGLQSGDSIYLSKITGIGKKTAEKMMLGLKEKIGPSVERDGGGPGSFAIDALTALGYSERDARNAVQKIKGIDNTEDIVREALKKLNN